MNRSIIRILLIGLIPLFYFGGCTTLPKNILNGDIKYSEGKYHWSIEYYTSAIEENPNDPRGYLKRARAESKLGRHSDAIQDYETALKIDRDNIPALISRGVEYIETQNLTAAEKSIRLALVEDSYSKTAFFILGYIYSLRSDYEAAVFYYSRAVELDSLYIEALVNRANAKGILGSHEEAIRDYSRALLINPADENLYIARGFDKSKAGNHEGAVSDYTRAVDMNGSNKDALLLRSESFRELKKYNEALKDINKLLNLSSDPEYLYRRGVIFAEMGKKKDACSDFRKAYIAGFAPSLDEYKEYCR